MHEELSKEKFIQLLSDHQGRKVCCRTTSKQNRSGCCQEMNSYHIRTGTDEIVLYEMVGGREKTVVVGIGKALLRIMTYLLDMRYIQLSYAAEILEVTII